MHPLNTASKTKCQWCEHCRLCDRQTMHALAGQSYAPVKRRHQYVVSAVLLQVDNARRLLPAAVAVEALQQDDAWFRDTGPSVSAHKCPPQHRYQLCQTMEHKIQSCCGHLLFGVSYTGLRASLLWYRCLGGGECLLAGWLLCNKFIANFDITPGCSL